MRPSIERKKKQVEELVQLMKGKRTVAVATVEGVPAPLMDKVRRELRGKAVIKVAKKNIIIRALEQMGDAKGLVDYLTGTSAIIVSDEDPFRLFKTVREHREYFPPKPGQVVDEDVVVPAGVTGVPAPEIADIKAVGLPAKVNKGMVEIEKDTVIVKAGEEVSADVARVLAKLGISPIAKEVKILAAFEGGIIFPREVLDVDTEQVLADVVSAHSRAFALALGVNYPTKDTLPVLISQAHTRALNLAINAGYVTGETAKHVLAQAYAKALALAARLPSEVTGV